ncbi:MAG: ABC transporter ATP-binding protein [Tepidanaerobacteraceae bacterium]
MADKLLEVKNLKTFFSTDEGIIRAVDGVDFSINKGEVLCIVGESGCGKSVTSQSILRLIPSPPGKIADGEVYFNGQNILKKTENEMRKIRGNNISMIFQEESSLNPVLTIGEQISEVIKLHQGLSKRQALAKAVEMLELVGIPSPHNRIHSYPHQMSGGMRQRVMIAMAVSCNPSLLIADEPTTALDVTVQAQILELIRNLKNKLGTALLMITHDLGVVAEMADNVIVMYAGQVVEYADVRKIFKMPRHPYTTGLMNLVPRLNQPKDSRPEAMKGVVPNPFELPKGCRFHPRCSEARNVCRLKKPALVKFDGRLVRCFKYTSEWEGEGIGVENHRNTT